MDHLDVIILALCKSTASELGCTFLFFENLDFYDLSI
jgi:hypothetical protein